MKLELLLKDAVSLEVALDRINNNTTTSFIWVPVKNKKGCHFEIGGRNRDKLDIKVYITPFENGEYRSYSNGFTNTKYALTNDGQYITSTSNSTISNFNSIDFIKFLDKTDFRTYEPKIKSVSFVREIYTTINEIKL